MNSSKKIFNGIIWTIIVNAFNGIYGFIIVPILLNYFGKEEYGIITLAMSVNVYMQLMDMGMNSTNVRYFSQWLAKGDIESTRKLFKTSLFFYSIVGLINSAILIIIAFSSNQIFNISSDKTSVLKELFLILSITSIINWFSSSFDQIIKSGENVDWIQKRSIIPKIFQLIVVISTVYFKFGIITYFIFTTFSILLILPLSIGKIKKMFPGISFIPSLDYNIFKMILPYSLKILSLSILQFSFYSLKPVILGIKGNISDVTDYKILSGIVGLVNMVGVSFLQSLLPSTNKVIAQNNLQAINKLVYDSVKYITIALSFFIFGLMTIDAELLTIYVGRDYLYLVPWINLSLLTIFESHLNGTTSLIMSGDNLKPLTVINSVASIVGLIFMYIFIPYLSIGGIVIAQVLYSIIQIIFVYSYYMPRLKINPLRVLLYFLQYVALGFASYISVTYIIRFQAHCLLILICKGFSFACLFIASTYFMLGNNDLKFIVKLIKK